MAADDSIQSRVSESRWKLYVLLGAERWMIATGLLALVFLALTVIVSLDAAPLATAIGPTDPIETLFQALVTAIITGVTLVVTINSLVISQELGAVGDQRERMQESLSFRDDVAELVGETVSPSEPTIFLRQLLEYTSDRAQEFQDATSDVEDDDLRRDVEDYVDELVQNAQDVESDLENSQFGTFNVLTSALNFNYSLKIRDGKAIMRKRRDDLGDDAIEALDDVLSALEAFGPAREHVKTLYFQWELVDLSRTMLYAAVPALIVSIGAILTLDNPGSVPGATLGVANVSWVVLAAATIALAPFAILLAYILRIATVAKRTLAIGPFILRTTDQSWQPED